MELDLRSDYRKIEDLLKTENISDIQFSETSEQAYNYNKKQRGGFTEFEYSDFDGMYENKLNKNQYGGLAKSKNSDFNEIYSDNQKENEMFAIFEKARNYRERVMENNEINQSGGGDESEQPKKKRTVNKTLALMLNLTKIMKTLGRYPDIKQKDFMKISKMILDDVKKKEGTSELTDHVAKIAEELAKNPDKYVQMFRQGTVQTSNANNRSFNKKSHVKSTSRKSHTKKSSHKTRSKRHYG